MRPFRLAAAAALLAAATALAEDPAPIDLRQVSSKGARTNVQETLRQEETQETTVRLQKEDAAKPESHALERTTKLVNRTEIAEEVLAVDERGVPAKVSRSYDKSELSGEGSQTADGETQPLEKFSQTLENEGAVVILEDGESGTEVTVKSGKFGSPYLEILQVTPVSEFDRYFLPGKPVRVGEKWQMEEKRFDRLVRGSLEAGLAGGLESSLVGRDENAKVDLKMGDIEGEYTLELAEISADGAVATLGLTGRYAFTVTGTIKTEAQEVSIDVKGKAKVSGTLTWSIANRAPQGMAVEEEQNTEMTMEATRPDGTMKVEMKSTNVLNRERKYVQEDAGAAPAKDEGKKSGEDE